MTMDERELEGIAARLGERAAERLDVEATADAVLQRLRKDRSLPARIAAHWRAGLAVAATVVLVTYGGVWLAHRGGEPTDSSMFVTAPVVPSLGALTQDQLGQVLDSLEVEAPPHEYVAATLNDLDAGQLRELLNRMEG